LAQGTLTIADERAPLELLFGTAPVDGRLGQLTGRIAVVAVQVKGVPQAAIDEALWIASAAIEA
jgi:hypothetical protein